MSDISSSEKAVASTFARQSLGRSSFRRPQKYHQGQRSDPTAYEALRQAAGKGNQNPPNELEMELLFKDNPKQVKIFQAAGLSNKQIYELLNNT